MLEKYSKKFKAVGIGLGAVALFGLGTVTGAATDWKTNAINSSYSEFLGTANQTTNELTSDISRDVNTKIQTEIQGTVDEQQLELERLLEEYYQMKLNGMVSSPEFLALETQIKDIQKSVLESYKQRIDEAFANQSPQ